MLTTYSVTGRQTTGTTQVPYHQGSEAVTRGVYLDDTYRISHAVVNIGVRYNYSRAMFQALPFLDATGRPTGAMSQANDDVYHWNVFSPRVGVEVPLGSNDTIVKAHYGRYYKALESAEYEGAVPSVSPGYAFALDAAGNRVNMVQVSSNANLRIDPDLKSAYSDQYIVQFEQQIISDLGFQVNYVYKSGHDYTLWQDIAGTYVQVPYTDSVGTDATGNPVMVYRLTSNPANRIFLQTTDTSRFPGNEMYNALQGCWAIGLTKRMSHNWQGVVSLVLSKAEGRLGSSARFTPVTNQSSQAGTFGREVARPTTSSIPTAD